MTIFNYAAREMTAKIVYYGPGLSGKTTSIQYIHTKISPKNKGKLVSLATETDRTLFFDFFPVEFGQIGGFKIKFNFYTVPGQVFYNTTRKLVLKGADGVVFVADSQRGMAEQNKESLDNLKENLKIHGIDWKTVPFIIQYNKRDLPGVMSVEEMRRDLNDRGVPDFETTATNGDGIMDAMKVICKMVLEEIQDKQKTGQKKTESSAAEQSPPKTKKPSAAEVSSSLPEARPNVKTTSSTVEIGDAIQKTAVLPISGPGTTAMALKLPLQINVEKGVEAVQIDVEVRISYMTQGKGSVQAKEIETESIVSEATSTPKKKGFFGRMFGG